ncbi:TolC family protein [Flavobacterium sp. TAB 87]|uniref:TolC family protein n=1 Tax=Flavobacterium sp. TAB 87 TaxID=1729581 RepID=UPI00076CEEE8|nr:TolC family protein [Flavobacterium sp. TAB 87]KVV13734.1 type I secretion outer membrane protein, TolC family [Flavobacterium sp. TAB 87]
MKYINKTNLLLLSLFILQITVAQELPERKMTIQQLADSLVAQNIQIKLADVSVKLADARIGDVKMNRLPDIGADMNTMYLSDVTIYDKHWSQFQKVDLPNFGHQFTLSAKQLIYAGGRITKGIELAELSKNLAENQFTDLGLGVKLNAAELYLNLYNLQNQKEILLNNEILANERLKNVKLFFDQNMVTKNEVLRAEVLRRQLEQNILQIQNSIEITNKNLLLYAGLREEVLIVPDVSNINHQIREQDEAYFLELAYKNNPQLSISDIQIAMSKKNLELTKAENMPTLAAFSGYNASRPMTSSVPALDFYSTTYQVGLNLSYNFETLYKNGKKVLVDKVLIEQAELAKIAVMQQIETQVNAAYKNYRQAVMQTEVSAINEKAADENYRITELKYKNQLVTITEIIDASNTKLQAELQTLDDRTAIILNYIKLLRVTGQL